MHKDGRKLLIHANAGYQRLRMAFRDPMQKTNLAKTPKKALLRVVRLGGDRNEVVLCAA